MTKDAVLTGFHAQSAGAYAAHVAPAVADVPHAAALIGPGSEVLGLDDDVSPDHDFALRVQLFGADPEGAAELRQRTAGVDACLVEVYDASNYFRHALGVDPADGVPVRTWLTTPTQELLELTAGAVFHDDGILGPRRYALAWYPDDVWRTVLAATWERVAQHQHLHGRTGTRDDAVGSRVIAARLAGDAMRLAFLVERRWAPYDKWLGTVFAGLGIAPRVRPALEAALDAADWRTREEALLAAFTALGEATNQLELAPAIDSAPVQFWSREYRVSGAERWAQVLTGAVTDPELLAWFERLGTRDGDMEIGPVVRLPGAFDQWSTNVEVATSVEARATALPHWPA